MSARGFANSRSVFLSVWASSAEVWGKRALDHGFTASLPLDALHEPAVRHLMRLYAESGRRGLAHDLYRSLADRLKAVLNAQPEAATRRLMEEISRGESQPHRPAHAVDQPIQHTKSVSQAKEKKGPSRSPAPVPETVRDRRPTIGVLAILTAVTAAVFYRVGRGSPPRSASPFSGSRTCFRRAANAGPNGNHRAHDHDRAGDCHSLSSERRPGRRIPRTCRLHSRKSLRSPFFHSRISARTASKTTSPTR